jgi:hypothetical protein
MSQYIRNNPYYETLRITPFQLLEYCYQNFVKKISSVCDPSLVVILHFILIQHSDWTCRNFPTGNTHALSLSFFVIYNLSYFIKRTKVNKMKIAFLALCEFSSNLIKNKRKQKLVVVCTAHAPTAGNTQVTTGVCKTIQEASSTKKKLHGLSP